MREKIIRFLIISLISIYLVVFLSACKFLEQSSGKDLIIDKDKIESASKDRINADKEGLFDEKSINIDSESDAKNTTIDIEADNTGSNSSDKDNNIDYSEKFINNSFYYCDIPDDIFEKMKGKSYKENCPVKREDLQYVHVLHIGFDGEIHEGELICSKMIAEDLLVIFRDLLKEKYPIEKIRLVDEYDADDEASMQDNNTSCFNYRNIGNSTKISKHGLGMAIDINPYYNPYVKEKNGVLIVKPEISLKYADRSEAFDYKIDKEDKAYYLFTNHGFSWGGGWKSSKDYQHFEK